MVYTTTFKHLDITHAETFIEEDILYLSICEIDCQFLPKKTWISVVYQKHSVDVQNWMNTGCAIVRTDTLRQ